MKSKFEENKIEDSTENKISQFLTTERCINAGVVFISSSDNKVKLGAMNPIYHKVLEILKEIKDKFSIEVEVSQITTQEWEKWNTEECEQFISNKFNNKIDSYENISLEEKLDKKNRKNLLIN